MLRRLFGGKPQDKTVSVVDVGTGDFGQPIVGESHYQEQLSSIAAGRTAKGERVEFRVVLVPEPSNKYDPNAVAVYAADGGIVGHLPREDAEEYQRAIAAFIKTRGKYPSCSATMAGGRGDKKTIGVWLDIDLDAL